MFRLHHTNGATGMAFIAWVTYVIAGIMNDIGTLAFAALEGFCYHLTYWYEEKKWR
jgi:hypothetical protein